VSIVRRGLDVFDTIVLAIAKDTPKKPLFPLEERVVMAEEVFAHFPQVVVEPFSGLLVEYVDNRGAQVVLRGLRAISDFEYEFQMALMNRRLKRDVHTLFMMTDYKWLFTSSSIIKETVSLGGDVQGLVPEPVWLRLRKKYAAE
jgi:pantetheine-phosphate adenylyltransferase